MDSPGYILLSRIALQSRSTQVLANNMANADTPGFRAQQPLFAAFLQRQREGALPGTRDAAYVQDRATWRETRTGPLQQTGNPLDIALAVGELHGELEFAEFGGEPRNLDDRADIAALEAALGDARLVVHARFLAGRIEEARALGVQPRRAVEADDAQLADRAVLGPHGAVAEDLDARVPGRDAEGAAVGAEDGVALDIGDAAIG